MKKRTALSLAVSMAISYPVSLQALGLGELHSSSQLNQPLNAQIDLLSTSAQEAGQLQVRLASPDVFSRVGIDRPDYLSSLKFSPTMVNGKPVIRVTSNQPISEPFLNFLLEVSWPQGQLLKEYTVLLDPPVLMQAGSATADNTATVRAEPNATGVVNRGQEADRQNQLAQQQRQRQIEIQQQQQAQSQAAQRALQEQRAFEAQAQAVINEPTPTARAASSGGSKYRVKRGDTMSRVASRLRYRGVTNNQMMVALFRANPHAFANENINYLKSGSLLTRPAKSEVTSQSSAETRQIVRQHYAQWKKFRSGLAANTTAQKAVPQGSGQQASTSATSESNKANLRVAGSTSDGVASNQVSAAGSEEQSRQLTLAQEALASSKSENAELQSRLGKLEAIIRKKDRLINLKNDHVAKLEAQLSTLSGGAVIPAAPLDETPEAVNEQEDLARQVGNEVELNSNKIIRGAEEATAEQQAALGTGDNGTATNLSGNEDAEAERLSEDASPFAVDDSEKKGGILDILTSPLVAAIGGGSLLALLLGWLLMRRSSSTTESDEMVVEDFKPAEDDFADDLDTDSPVLDDDFDGFGGDTGFDTEPAMETRFEETQEHKDEVAESEDAFDSILTGDDTIEDDEILQEADVYIVYGLHEQAEEELKKAINDNPAKLEYRYKLLENYKAAGQSDKFIDTAKDFLAAEGDNKQQLWDKITTWGKEVAPENDMFSESSAASAAGVLAGAAGLGAAAKVAQEAFADDDLASDFEASLDSADIDLGSDDDLQISGLDGKDFELDLDDDFGLDELAGEMDASDFEASGNVLSFGASAAAKAESETPTDVSLEIDQDSGLDKVLPAGSAYVTNDSDSSDDSSADEFDDALSFLDLSDDEEMQEAHIGTKLDLARAYLDMGDVEGARCTLEEVVIEGNDDQKREAEELLQQTG